MILKTLGTMTAYCYDDSYSNDNHLKRILALTYSPLPIDATTSGIQLKCQIHIAEFHVAEINTKYKIY